MFLKRNLPLLSYLHAYKALYICRDTSTDIESSLQIRLFMQNEPNFGKAQMNVNPVITREYKNNSNWTLGENEPKTNPSQIRPSVDGIKPNFKKAKMNVTSYITAGYENISNWTLFENKPNIEPIQTQTKPISKARNAAAYDTGDCQRKIFKKIVNGIDRYLVMLYTGHYGKSIFRQLVNTASQGNA